MESELRIDELLSAAASAGYEVSARVVEDWRYRGLLPRPVRSGSAGRRPRWVYQPGADAQLVDLCRWREHTRDLEAIRVALWVDGHPIPEPDVQTAIAHVLERLRTGFEVALTDEAAREPAVKSRDDALKSVARKAAGARGGRPTPKVVRMKQDERADGLEFLARLMLGDDLTPHVAKAANAERAIGLSPGRRGSSETRWLTGPPEDLAQLADTISFPILAATIKDATSDELDRARGFARVFVQGLPIIARFAEASLGPQAAGLAAAKGLAEIGPEFYSLLIPALVALMRRGHADDLDVIGTPLSKVADLAPAIDELAAKPKVDRRQQLDHLPPSERPTINRLLVLTNEEKHQAGN